MAIDCFFASQESEIEACLGCARRTIGGNVKGTGPAPSCCAAWALLAQRRWRRIPPPFPLNSRQTSFALYFLTNEKLSMIDRQSVYQPMTFIFLLVVWMGSV